jgi:hypothetical protein
MMFWYPILLSKNPILFPVIKNKKTVDINYRINDNNKPKTELDNIIKTYDLSLLQINYIKNEIYYIQNETNYVYKLENINNVHFLSIIIP